MIHLLPGNFADLVAEILHRLHLALFREDAPCIDFVDLAGSAHRILDIEIPRDRKE